jgi:HEPN domain-containing protein
LERFEEAKRWLMQALRDLSVAVESFRDGYFEWSCFQELFSSTASS